MIFEAAEMINELSCTLDNHVLKNIVSYNDSCWYPHINEASLYVCNIFFHDLFVLAHILKLLIMECTNKQNSWHLGLSYKILPTLTYCFGSHSESAKFGVYE